MLMQADASFMPPSTSILESIEIGRFHEHSFHPMEWTHFMPKGTQSALGCGAEVFYEEFGI